MEVGEEAPDLPIQKKVLHAGRGDLPKFTNGTKVRSISTISHCPRVPPSTVSAPVVDDILSR